MAKQKQAKSPSELISTRPAYSIERVDTFAFRCIKTEFTDDDVIQSVIAEDVHPVVMSVLMGELGRE